ncbi:ATP-binding protein [Piscinibacter koreensis]|nr:ATP-binding protein [Schlegelella koreensis]
MTNETPPSPATEIEVQREVMRLVLHNSARSVPVQIGAVVVLVLIGAENGRYLAAGATAVVGIAVAIWRLQISRWFQQGALSKYQLRRAQLHLEGNSLLSGCMWLISAFGIYAHTSGQTAIAYIMFACGSVCVAALFMSLVGRSFLLLAIPELGGIIAVTLDAGGISALPLSLLTALFGYTMYKASRKFTDTTASAIRHRLMAESLIESLAAAKEAAEAANRAKSQFLATMSHEIRTPMNGVLGALDLLRHSRLDANQRALVRTAASSGTSLMAILNDVLDHSKIEAGKLALHSAPFSLRAMCAAVIGLFEANAEAKGLLLQLDFDADTVDWVLVDGQRLKQVVLNLLGNAIKFTERGEVTLRVSSRPHGDDHHRVSFEVLDTGIGMTPDALTGLFQPFHQVDGKRNRRQSGTGLGLAISQRIVEAMGGRIVVTSSVGSGSRFHFSLLLEADPQREHPPVADSAMGSLDASGTVRGIILLVEDNEVNRLIGTQTLHSMGLDVIEATDGLEALSVLQEQHVDLILMDCQMPVMDGYEATREIRRREAAAGRARTPIVALTADAFDDDAARSRQAGMDAHLAKPYTRTQLLSVISAWI